MLYLLEQDNQGILTVIDTTDYVIDKIDKTTAKKVINAGQMIKWFNESITYAYKNVYVRVGDWLLLQKQNAKKISIYYQNRFVTTLYTGKHSLCGAAEHIDREDILAICLLTRTKRTWVIVNSEGINLSIPFAENKPALRWDMIEEWDNPVQKLNTVFNTKNLFVSLGNKLNTAVTYSSSTNSCYSPSLGESRPMQKYKNISTGKYFHSYKNMLLVLENGVEIDTRYDTDESSIKTMAPVILNKSFLHFQEQLNKWLFYNCNVLFSQTYNESDVITLSNILTDYDMLEDRNTISGKLNAYDIYAWCIDATTYKLYMSNYHHYRDDTVELCSKGIDINNSIKIDCV